MLTSEDIRQRLLRRPFESFRITTRAGHSVDVYHPEQVIVTRRSIGVATTKTLDHKDYDHIVTISILHVASLEELPIVPMLPDTSGLNGTG